MKIENVYIGGWFQRTILQLTEIYGFLRNGTSQLKLESEKLEELRKNLFIGKIDYGSSGLEYIEYSTSLDINVKIFEDGLIVLNNRNIKEDTLFTDIDEVKDYYENNLSPAISYLFSLGAPVPKELANIETVYPYFIVLNNASREQLTDIMSRTEKQKYFELENKDYDVIRGDKYYFINDKTNKIQDIERYIEEQIFMREFKGQLHRYLNLHRIIWEKIDEVKDKKNVNGKDIITFTTKLEGYSKTINLIDSRINQMGTYISTREKVAKSDEKASEFLGTFGYKYETLRNTLSYVQQLWSMTKNYVNSATAQFNNVRQDVTKKSVDNLTVVTSMSAGASIIGLLTRTEPEFTIFGIIYFFILALIVYFSNKILKFVSVTRKYSVSGVDYDTDIK